MGNISPQLTAGLTAKGRQVTVISNNPERIKAIGKLDLQWVQFSDEQLLGALLQNGFSKDAAQHYIVDMGIAIREGILDKHYKQNTYEVVGKRSFADFTKEFAFVYGGS